MQSSTSSSTVLKETTSEVGFPPEGRSDWVEGVVEPAPPGRNSRLHQTPFFALENFFSEPHNQMLIEQDYYP
jgi:hypothetical protein